MSVFKYSILYAIPDRGRGERVNVGIVVFLDDKVDVRVTDLQKVRALTGHDWSRYGERLTRLIRDRFSNTDTAEHAIETMPQIDRVFQFSSLAWFSATNEAEYAESARRILKTLVYRPKPDPRPRGSLLNTQIAWHFSRLRVLASQKEDVGDHRVFRDATIEEGIKVDFLQMNGAYRAIATLDLRRPKPDIRDAALKAMVLDRAKVIPTIRARTIGVIASGPVKSREVDTQAGFIQKYADQVYNWESATDKKALTKYILDGMTIRGPLM